MKAELVSAWFSSLVKIMPDTPVSETPYTQGETLRGERFNFQLMLHSRSMHNRWAEFRLETDLPCPLSVRQVGLVPVAFTGFSPCDKDVISSRSGIFPDRLLPLPTQKVRIVIRRNIGLWFTADIPEDCPPGRYSVRLHFTVHPDDCDEECRRIQRTEHFESPVFQLQVLTPVLPPLRLKVTQWFHADCLSAVYKVPMWSEKHWSLMERFLKNAAMHGMNMVLTPLLSLTLNVLPGCRRELSQLLLVSRRQGRYNFDFFRFDRFVRLAEKCGLTYFEISHFFSQWGAAFAPPVEVDGELLFDGSVPGDSPEYLRLLEELLPKLKEHLKELGIAGRTVFHCSDEPGKQHTETYRRAMAFLRRHLPKSEFRILDAVNDSSVCRECGIDTPVPLTVQLHRFRGVKVPERWTYYCCVPVKNAPNRFIHFPSSRNRIFGTLLWKYRLDGFLHWGYNFYFEALSRRTIDPEKDQTSGDFYPPGDAFLVYPGENGTPIDSIRHEVFLEALQDFRALDLLAGMTTQKNVRSLLSRWCGRLTMTEYPRGERNVLALRHRINQAIVLA
ncbi:MAG: DUF4091 domain-containing protein [Victivallales bacterium]|nr:DUF4091 domain-containing protein [Victivallales bacterium]